MIFNSQQVKRHTDEGRYPVLKTMRGFASLNIMCWTPTFVGVTLRSFSTRGVK